MNIKEKMKTKYRLLPLLLCVLLFFAGGCDSNEDIETFETFDGYETLQLLDWNDEWDRYFENPWVHWETYKNQEGIVVETNIDNGWYEAIEIKIVNPPTGKKEGTFLPVNVDKNRLPVGAKIIFSGEARDNCKLDYFGIPLILDNIQIKGIY